MGQSESNVLVSPFKFGFFAGLGFFFASALMSVLSVVFVAIIGIGTLGSLFVGSTAARWQQTDTTAVVQSPVVEATPAAAVIAPRSTYHRKSRTYGDE